MKKFLKILAAYLFILNISHAQTITLTEVAKDFNFPLGIVNAGDDRLFIVEQTGTIQILKSGIKNAEAFLDIKNKVLSGGERGLLGLAFHPNYISNGFFYLNYTDKNGNTVIARYSRSQNNPDLADESSEKIILQVEQPYENHNGGQLNFGPDGYLYIGLGDGGSGGDPQKRAQNLSLLLGKLLRIDVSGDPYTIPSDNPFVSNGNARHEIWALGLRNPWRFTFDRANGDLYIADVGQDEYEEIDYQPSSSKGGENYGWRCYEANTEYLTDNCPSRSELTFPVYAYNHQSNNCSVTGGYVYRGTNYPSLQNKYIFADFCSGIIWTMSKTGDQWGAQQAGQYNGESFTAFGEDKNGELYLANFNGGKIYRVEAGSTDINSNNPEKKIKVYPTLFKDIIHIEVLIPSSKNIVFITDMQGKKVFSTSFKGNKYSRNLSKLSSGDYVIQINTETETFNYKLTKQ